MTKNYVEIGKITSTVGLRGEVKVYSYTQSLDRFNKIDEVYIDDILYGIDRVAFVKSGVKVKLTGVDDVEFAKTFIGKELFIDKLKLEELPNGEFYIRDLIGFDVFSDSGEKLGVLKNIRQDTSQDLYVIDDGQKEFYIPGVKEFLKEISLEESKVVVKLIEGLID